MTEAELLRKARDLISDPTGWTKGRFKRQDCYHPPRYCAVGALMEASAEDVNRTTPACERLERIVAKEGWSITAYNDDEDTTHQDILDLFDCAIKQAEEAAGVPF